MSTAAEKLQAQLDRLNATIAADAPLTHPAIHANVLRVAHATLGAGTWDASGKNFDLSGITFIRPHVQTLADGRSWLALGVDTALYTFGVFSPLDEDPAVFGFFPEDHFDDNGHPKPNAPGTRYAASLSAFLKLIKPRKAAPVARGASPSFRTIDEPAVARFEGDVIAAGPNYLTAKLYKFGEGDRPAFHGFAVYAADAPEPAAVVRITPPHKAVGITRLGMVGDSVVLITTRSNRVIQILVATSEEMWSTPTTPVTNDVDDTLAPMLGEAFCCGPDLFAYTTTLPDKPTEATIHLWQRQAGTWRETFTHATGDYVSRLAVSAKGAVAWSGSMLVTGVIEDATFRERTREPARIVTALAFAGDDLVRASSNDITITSAESTTTFKPKVPARGGIRRIGATDNRIVVHAAAPSRDQADVLSAFVRAPVPNGTWKADFVAPDVQPVDGRIRTSIDGFALGGRHLALAFTMLKPTSLRVADLSDLGSAQPRSSQVMA